jgi:hypothetical protein
MPIKGNRLPPRWFRHGHRWVGISLLVFVLFLAITGITLNHSADLGLDRRYVSWSWLLDAYGMEAPEPSASFEDGGYRATLLGERLFLDGKDTEQSMSSLVGLVALEPLLLVAGEKTAYLFMTNGEMVESIDMGGALPGPIERAGAVGARAVISSNNELFRSDEDIAVFQAWRDNAESEISWSVASTPDADSLAELETAWRGRGVTVERFLLDLHSGRILNTPGTVLMDIVAACMILLGISGLVLSNSRNSRENGSRKNRPTSQ